MDKSDAKAFQQSLNDCYELFGKEPLGRNVMVKWWAQFEAWSLQDFQKALELWEGKGKFAPKPADLKELAASMSGRPSADEAWATALVAADETETVVWTAETAEAFAAASEILSAGDKVGARMAFKAAYERACDQATGMARWQISLGHDAERREAAIRDGLVQGLLTHEQAERHLPLPPPTAEGKAVAGLLTGEVVDLPSDSSAKERIAELRRTLEKQQRDQAEKHEQERRESAEALREKKREAAEAVARFEAEHLSPESEAAAREKLAHCQRGEG